MAQNKRPSRPASRTPSRAPRRIAGHTPRPLADEEPTDQEPTSADPGVETDPPVRKKASPAPAKPKEPAAKASERGPGFLTDRRTTKVLGGVLALLLVIGIAELAYLFVFDGEEETDTSAQNPVAVQMSEWRSANDQAAKSVTEVLNVSWKEYDKNLEDAKALMTPEFAKEYASTTSDSKARFLRTKAEYDFAVVGQSVVEASPDEATSLLFLNQFVYKGEGKARVGPEIYQVRVEVHLVREGDKWLIDDLKAL